MTSNLVVCRQTAGLQGLMVTDSPADVHVEKVVHGVPGTDCTEGH